MDPSFAKLVPINFDNGEQYSNENRDVVPENQRVNPECPCRTRGCHYHGFCRLCVDKHRNMNKAHGIVNGHESLCWRIREEGLVLDESRRP